MCSLNASSFCHRPSAPSSWARLTRLASLAPFVLSFACRTTPLDVVYAVDLPAAGDGASSAGTDGGTDTGAGGAAANGGGGSGGGVDANTCSIVEAGRYALRSQVNGLCLGQGAPTTVFTNPAFQLDFAAECRQPARSWLLAATATPRVFSIQNALPPGFVLDVQMAGTRDGTPVITYGENGFDNQRFEVRARDSFVSELRPQHHPQSCVAAVGTSAQIMACDPADAAQAWLLQRTECL